MTKFIVFFKKNTQLLREELHNDILWRYLATYTQAIMSFIQGTEGALWIVYITHYSTCRIVSLFMQTRDICSKLFDGGGRFRILPSAVYEVARKTREKLNNTTYILEWQTLFSYFSESGSRVQMSSFFY